MKRNQGVLMKIRFALQGATDPTESEDATMDFGGGGAGSSDGKPKANKIGANMDMESRYSGNDDESEMISEYDPNRF
jgi:hypothetical protein